MILIGYGTRPEQIKLKPVVDSFIKHGIPHKIIFTGQHKDLATKINEDTVQIELKDISDNRLNNVLIQPLAYSSNIFDNVTHVMVQGDTTTALGFALAAFNMKIPVIHLEAGLRSFDYENPYPEEMNRVLISKIASIHLAPTEYNKKTLLDEGISSDKIFVVGNTGLDTLSQNLIDSDVKKKDIILITLHRRENQELIEEWLNNIDKLSQLHETDIFIFIKHPNLKNKNLDKFKNIIFFDPIDNQKLHSMFPRIKAVITDSGGLQEECSFTRTPCFVCRKTTERPEALEKTSFLVETPSDLIKSFKIRNVKFMKDVSRQDKNIFGDGNASDKISSIMKRFL